MTRSNGNLYDLKALAPLKRATSDALLGLHYTRQPPEPHPCDAPAPSKRGEPCGRWLGTKQLPDGSWRCVNHAGPKVPRLRNPRDVIVALERLEPTLRGLLGWLDAHRVASASPRSSVTAARSP